MKITKNQQDEYKRAERSERERKEPPSRVRARKDRNIGLKLG